MTVGRALFAASLVAAVIGLLVAVSEATYGPSALAWLLIAFGLYVAGVLVG
jgi:hypothetical protein